MERALNLMESFYALQQLTFPELLQALLDEHNCTKSDLFDYLIEQQYPLEKTSMYRYFNPNPNVSRMPDTRFLCLFAQYLQLTEAQTAALYALQIIKRDLRS